MGDGSNIVRTIERSVIGEKKTPSSTYGRREENIGNDSSLEVKSLKDSQSRKERACAPEARFYYISQRVVPS